MRSSIADHRRLVVSIGSSLVWHALVVMMFSSIFMLQLGSRGSGVPGDAVHIPLEFVQEGPSILEPIAEQVSNLFEASTDQEVLSVPDAPAPLSIDKPALDVPAQPRRLGSIEKVSVGSDPRQTIENWRELTEPTAQKVVDKGQRQPADDSLVRSRILDDQGKAVNRRVEFSPPLPAYPEWARESGKEFKAEYRILVSPAGWVKRVEVLISSGASDVDTLCVRHLRRHIFEPKGTEAWYVVPFHFALQGKNQ